MTLPDDIEGAMFRYIAGDDQSELALLKAQLEHMGGVLSTEIKLNAEARAELDHITAERDAARKALELIAAFKGKTIFSMEPEYRAGANAAYEQAADIAIDALATQHASDCAVHNAPALPTGPCDCGATLSVPDADR